MILPRSSSACALAPAVYRDSAEHCPPSDQRHDIPGWRAPRKPDHSPRIDFSWISAQSSPRLLCRLAVDPRVVVLVTHRIRARRVFGTIRGWCRVGPRSPPRSEPCGPVDGQSRRASHLGIREPQTPLELRLQNPVLSNQILIPQTAIAGPRSR